MVKFLETKTERFEPLPEPISVKAILAYWEDPAFDMPDWYMDGWEPSN